MEYLKVWTNFAELLEPLTDAERGRLFVAMLEYAKSGAEPCLTGNERYVWPSARQNIKRAADENDKMKAIGQKGGRQKKLDEPTETYGNLQKPTETYGNLTKAYKEKEKDKYITTTTSAGACEETKIGEVTVDPLVIKAQQELNGLTDTHYQALYDYRDELGDDLVSRAIDEAVGNGVRNWSYVQTILANYLKDGIRTVGEAKARDEKRKQTYQKPGKVVSAQKYTQREYNDQQLEDQLGVNDLFSKDWDGVL